MVVPLAAAVVAGALLLVALALAISVTRLWGNRAASGGQGEADGSSLLHRQSLDGEPWWERALVSRRLSMDASVCRMCSRATAMQCGRCKSVKYCSVPCQQRDWASNHKFECPNLRAAAVAAAAAAAAAGAALPVRPGAHGKPRPPPPGPDEDAPIPGQVLFPYDQYLALHQAGAASWRPPVGLVNLGNNCYANAALQCLLACQPLRAYLESGFHSGTCNRPSRAEWCLLCELQSLSKSLASAQPGGEVSVRPLLRHLRRFARTLYVGRQEDAHEFLYCLLNTMEAIQLTNYGGKERFDVRTQETTLVHHAYGGYLRSQVVCSGCGAASRRFEACLDVTLEVPPGVDRLEAALGRYTAEELLDGDNRYACDACCGRCQALRCTRFEVAPNTLVLCLKRFGTGRFGKINKPLLFGEGLDLSPFMADDAVDPGPASYNLTCVVVHLDQMNSTSFGHYVAYVRSPDGRWWACDDGDVAPSSAARVLSQHAYMLFYTRSTPKPPPPRPGFRRAKTAVSNINSGSSSGGGGGRAAACVNGPAVAAPAALELQRWQLRSMLEQQSEQQQQPWQENGVDNEAVPLQAQQLQPSAAAEQLARVATAPAALVRLGSSGNSSSERSSRDESDLSPASSLRRSMDGAGQTTAVGSRAGASSLTAASQPVHNTAAVNGVRTCAQQVQQVQQQPAPTSRWLQQAKTDMPTSSTAFSGVTAAAAAQGGGRGGGGGGRRRRVDNAASGRSSTYGLSSGSAGGAAPPSELAHISYTLRRASPELLKLRVALPGVQRAADVHVVVRMCSTGTAAAGEPELVLSVPGGCSPAIVPLGRHLNSGMLSVARVTGTLYRRAQLLSLKLHLCSIAATNGDAGLLDWHSTDCDVVQSSSGSEGGGWTQHMNVTAAPPPVAAAAPAAARMPRASVSEVDLAGLLGRTPQKATEKQKRGNAG